MNIYGCYNFIIEWLDRVMIGKFHTIFGLRSGQKLYRQLT